MRPPMDVRPRDRAISSVALLFSGAAALVYESTWGRMLHRVFGVSDWAVATVLAAFFLGMGIGSALGGKLAKRATRPLRVYAALEMFTAAWALASLFLVPRIHLAYAGLGPNASFAMLTAARFALALLVLLPPTIAMGATLPVLVRRFEASASWQSEATLLYTVNTLGAAIGAGATGFYLLPAIGAHGSILIAATLGIAAAAVALVGMNSRRDDTDAPALPPQAAPDAIDVRVVMMLAFASGFLALGGEVLFTRLLRIVVQGTSQAFAAMLVCYLGGIALGSAITRRRNARGSAALFAFGAVQATAAVLIFFAIASASFLPRLVGLMRGEAELVPNEVSVIIGIAALTLLPLSTCVGMGLPLILEMPDSSDGSGSVGKLLAANTIGGLLGSLVAGFAAIPALGLEVALYALAILHAGVALLALLTAAGDSLTQRLVSLGGVIGVVASALVLRPSIHLPFLLDAWSDASRSIIEGPVSYDNAHVVFVREGRNTTVSVVDRDGVLRLFNDGRPESGISSAAPYFGPELVMLGGLPALFAEHRDRAMVIGLGAGHSATSLLAGGFEHVDVVELEPAVVDAARRIHRMRNRPFPLDDRRRTSLVVDDARARLALAGRGTYDAIVSQPSHPWLSGVSALYTREFFLESQRALRRGGVLSLWVNVFRMDLRNLRAIVATLRSVFPHNVAFVVEDSSFLLLASDSPFEFDERLGARISSAPGLRELLAGYELDSSAKILASLELDDEGSRRFATGGELLVDDKPTLEYALSTLPHRETLSGRELDAAFHNIPWIAPETQRALPPHLRSSLPLHRLSRLEGRRTGLLRVELAATDLALDAPARALLAGALDEMLGDVRGALAHYDTSTDVEAATRADALRLVDGSAWEAIAVARPRATVPHDATSLVRAAFITRERGDFELALGLATRAEDGAEAPYRRVATAYLARGCLGALATEVDSDELDPPALAFLADCAESIGDRVRARQLDDDRALARRALAQQWYERGQTATDGGNVALGVHFFRRSLANWPAHRDAADRLADALCVLGRCADAAPILRFAIDAQRFAPAQADLLRATARRLEITLPP